MQPTLEVLSDNQKVANEAHHQANLQPAPVPDFDFKNALMGQQEPNMMDNELQQQKQNQQQHHVHHQQEYQQQQEWQQQQQQILPNPMYQLPMQTFLQEQQDQMIPNQIEQFYPMQQQPMEVAAPGQEQHQHLQQLDQQQNYFTVGNLNSQQLEDTYPQYQQQYQQIQSVNQHELIPQQQERAVSGI